jgi:hypothetical protein
MADPIKEYTGEQILISSGRLVFNTDDNNILFNSKGTIHFSTSDSIRYDIGPEGSTNQEKNFFIINSPYVQLGYDTKGRTVEPATKADALEETVNEQNEALTNYSKLMEAAVNFPPLSIVASVFLKLKMNNIRNAMAEPGNVKSDTVSII